MGGGGNQSRDYALLVLRLSGFYLAAAHGWPKLVGLASGSDAFVRVVDGLGFPLPVLFAWLAMTAEFVGGICIGLGVATRIASAFAGVVMVVAAFVRHKFHLHLLSAIGLPVASQSTLDSSGNPERAVLFLLILIGLALLGPGGLSVDAKLRDRGRG